MWTSLLGFSAAPALLTLVCLDGGTAGWFGLGGFLAVLGLAAGPATHWAERTRGRFLIPGGGEA